MKQFSVLIALMFFGSTTWAAGAKELVKAVKSFSDTSTRSWVPPYSMMKRDGLEAFEEFTKVIDSKNPKVFFSSGTKMAVLTSTDKGQSGIIQGLKSRPDGSIERSAFHIPKSTQAPQDYQISHRQGEDPGVFRSFETNAGKTTASHHYDVEMVNGKPMRVQQNETLALRSTNGNDDFYKGSVSQIKDHLYINIENDAGYLGAKIHFPTNEGRVVKFHMAADGQELTVLVARDENKITEYMYRFRPATQSEIKSDGMGRNLQAELRGTRALTKEEIKSGEFLAYMKVYPGRKQASSIRGLEEGASK